jgi:hypothetical protein
MTDSLAARVSVLEDSQRTEEGLPSLQEYALRFPVLAAVSSNGEVHRKLEVLEPNLSGN